VNYLFVTLDQFRGDSYGAVGHPLVETPTLDAIAEGGTVLANHYSQAAPCSPGRAALYTGTYQMNNRVVANGTPSPEHFDNFARVARRAGYDPTLFGYTDQGVAPELAIGDDDPRLNDYDGVLPGLSIGCYLPENQAPWVAWLRSLGHDVPSGWQGSLSGESERPAEQSLTTFLTDRFLGWLDRQDDGWFAHLSYLRPHPPYAAAGEFSRLYDPADVGASIEAVESAQRHPLHDLSLQFDASAAPKTPDGLRHLKAQYYGMISEVDAQLGRVMDRLRERGQWDDTVIVITSDHGEQLGDHGLKEKLAFFPQSYHVIGIWRDPRLEGPVGRVDEFTENVDLLATLCDALGVDTPSQVDGRSLAPLLRGEQCEWRTAAHYEWDWRYFFIGRRGPWPNDRHLSRQNLAVSLSTDTAYVQFGDGSYRCFDLASDPTWRTECTDDARVLAAAQELLVWRQEHLARESTDMMLGPSRLGRWPDIGTRSLRELANSP
jgi:arylsulfatase A-like enzyme